MNYLAHTLLADPTPLGRAGSLLGDFWRGAPDPAWPAELAAGVILHRRIDSATDRNPVFVDLRARLPPEFRRYGGIVLDVAFDHVLTRQWSRHTDLSLRAHVDAVNAGLREVAARDYSPPAFALFARRAVAADLLATYGEVATVERAFRYLSRRLKRANPIAEAWDALAPLLPELHLALPMLLEDLRAVSLAWRESHGTKVPKEPASDGCP